MHTQDRIASRRLERFLGAMLPIAVAYLAVFVVAALAWRNVALGVGSVAIVLYIGALVAARRELSRGRVERAALLTGSGLLAMIGTAAPAVHFQYPAFVLMSIAAVVVVLPHVDSRTLRWFAAAALGVGAAVMVVGALQPSFTQPPRWFCLLVLLTSTFAAAALIVVMLAADHRRIRGLLDETAELADVAHRQRIATDAFLVAASHQFRTPVSTLLLQSESLLRNASDDASKNRSLRLVRSAERLHLLVDTMLDVSRITSGSLRLDTTVVDVAALVREVAEMHAAHAGDAGVELIVNAPDSAVETATDARRLELVTSHLIDNAVRLGPGAPARIEVFHDAADVLIAITDGGARLDAAARERIFERTTVATAAGERDGGAGLGLWLVRELSQAMGGQVAVRAGDEGGTRFEVRLPRRDA